MTASPTLHSNSRASSSTASLSRARAALPSLPASSSTFARKSADVFDEKERKDDNDGHEKMAEIPLQTLGDGPIAPIEAAENAASANAARKAIRKDENLEYVEPGLKGWLNLLGAVLVNSICYGMTNSYGVFQEYYTTTYAPTISSGATAISWIGTVQFWLCPLLGCISGPLFDAGYLKSLVGIGGGLYVFSLMMTSLAKEYYQFLLAHGFGVGMGMGLIFSPSVSTLSHHFGRSRWRTLAYGCQASGSSLAGIIIPVMLRQLIPAVGFAWALRILGFIVLLVVVCAFFFLSRVHPPRKELALLSPTVFQNKAYTVYVLGAGLGSLAIYAPLTFGATYMRAKGFDPGLSFYAVAIGNGCSIFGRIIPLMIAQKVGTINIFTLFALISGTMLFLWTTAKTVQGFLIYEAFYGVASGAYAASLNPGAASFAPEANQSGLYLGMCFFTTAWFWLPGTPATAALIQGKTDYLPASIFCGCAVLGGGLILIGARFMRARQVGSKWV